MLNRGVIDHVSKLGIDIGGGETRKRRGAKNSALLLLVPHAAVDDQVDAVHQGPGEAGGGVGALLVAVVERGGGAAAVGGEFIEPDRGIDEAAAGKTQLLVVAGQGQERGQIGRGVVEIADPVALVERVVDAVAVGLDAVAVERGRPRAEIGRGRDRSHARVEGADAGLGADRDRRAADAVLQHDVDDAADRIVAVQHRAAVAAGDLDALDRIARNGRKIDAGHIDVVEPAAVDQHQGIGGRKRAETSDVDAGLRRR